jgi:hypothetical protein
MKSHYLFAEIIALALIFLVPFRVKGETDSIKASARDAWTRLPEEGCHKNATYAWVENDPNQPEWWAKPGDVHYNTIGQQAQGDEVARVIVHALESRNIAKRRKGTQI